MSFPKLPEYRFSWRSLQLEPVPFSGERITVGIVGVGEKDGLIVLNLLPGSRLDKIYGQEFGKRIADAVSLCIRYAEKHYKVNPLSTPWSPPLEGFFLNDIQSSVAANADEGLLHAAMDCSSFSASLEIDRLRARPKRRTSTPDSWRRRVFAAAIVEKAELTAYFGRSITMSGSGVPLKFGFLSSHYAAEFDVVGSVNRIQRSLSRVQSRLWQLERLRDEENLLFRPDVYELVLEKPAASDEIERVAINEYVEKLRQEASRLDIGLYATESPEDAARHLIENAA